MGRTANTKAMEAARVGNLGDGPFHAGRKQQQQASDSSVPSLSCGVFSKSNPGGRLMADRVSGAAWRRRQCRLRSWWRHEQQTVAAVLAMVTHHSHSKAGAANAAPAGTEDWQQHRRGTRRVL